MSYLEYFKFARQPFSEHASREALWNDTRMEEGLSRLNHLLGNGLVGLVTGASGLGKSALVRRFIQECSPQVCDPQYCHLLSGDALVDLRLLVSSAVEAGPPLKILLVGQEPLRHTLKRAEYADIVNRVSVRYQLKPLSKDQTRKYIDYSVGSSGGDVKIFDERLKNFIGIRGEQRWAMN